MANIIEHELEKDEDQYEEMLNDIYGTVGVCGFEYGQGTLLREIDPIAFQCGLSDAPVEYEYECGICGEVYSNSDEAEECCEDKAQVLAAIEERRNGEFDGLVVSDTSEVPEDYCGAVLHINDHGNTTLYSAVDGILDEVGSIV